MKDISEMTEREYKALIGRLAAAMRTSRQYITIEKVVHECDEAVKYRVKRKGEHFRQLIEERLVNGELVTSNLGVII